MKLGKYIALFFICCLLVIGCNQTQSNNIEVTQTDTTQPGRVTIGTTLKARTLDPADSYELAGLNIIYNVGESLYTYELGSTKLKPLLAKEMPTVSQDGLTYTISLREGVTFHDGTPFNAEAMVFSLQRFKDNGGKPSFLLADSVESISASKEYEITIKLKQPFAAFPALLAFPGTCAVSPQAYKLGVGEFNPNQLIGTGRYKLTNFSSDSIRLDLYESYWGDKAANEGIDIQIYAGNSANLFNSFKTKAIDVAYQSLEPDQIKNLQQGASEGKLQLIEAAGTAVNYMVLNRKQKPLDQLEVRQAIASVINRALIIDRVLQGQSQPIYSLIPTAFDVYKPVFEKYNNGNIEATKQLLEKSGFSAANPATIEIWYSSGSTTRGIVASTLKAIADKELGGAIQFQPNGVEFATAAKNLREGIYPTFLSDWYPDFLDADNYIQPFLECSKGSPTEGCVSGASQTQGSFYYSDRMNELIALQRKEQNPQTRQKIIAEIQELLAADLPYIPLWQTKDYVFAQNGLNGVTINPSQYFAMWTINKKS